MRLAYLLLLASCVPLSVAQAQKPKTTTNLKALVVGPEPLELRAYLADTAKATDLRLPVGTTVSLVSVVNKNWIIVKRPEYDYRMFQYYVPAKNLGSFEVPAYLKEQQQLQEDQRIRQVPFPIDADTKRITYQEVIEVPGVSKDELYTRAYEWMAKTYRSANTVIQMHDKEAGRMVGKGATVILRDKNDLFDVDSFVRHTLSIYVKDGRYKYILTDFEYLSPIRNTAAVLEPENTSLGGGPKNGEAIRSDTKHDIYQLTNSLKEAMAPAKGKDASEF